MNVEYFYDEIEIIETLLEYCDMNEKFLKVDNLNQVNNFLIYIEEKIDKHVQIVMDILYSGEKCELYENLIESNEKIILENLQFFEEFVLPQNTFILGPDMTYLDLILAASISKLFIFFLDEKTRSIRVPNITSWFMKIFKLP